MNEAVSTAKVPLADIWAYLVPHTRGKTVLHIGSGSARTFEHWTTIDSRAFWGGRRVADVDADGLDPLPYQDGKIDAIVTGRDMCRAGRNLPAVIAEWWRALKPGGHLALHWRRPDGKPLQGPTIPAKGPLDKPALFPPGPWPIDVVKIMRGLGGWDLLEDEHREAEGDHWQVYRKREDAFQNVTPWRKPERSCLVIRYGGFGDAIQASSILPLLRRQGWHVTFNAHPKTQDVLLHDPNVDHWVIQDENQVANANLGPYWEKLAERYDRVINLCESAEMALLTVPQTLHDKHTDGARRRLYRQDYLERLHDIADVPYEFSPRFFPEAGEIDYIREKMKGVPRPWILWVVTGSTFHKMWPYIPEAIVRLMYRMPGSFILAGDDKFPQVGDAVEKAANGFYGTGGNPRIMRTDGRWPIRGTLALAQMCDLVVGPETGVLNAVSMEAVPKIVLMSHSGPWNLTGHWTNTRSLTPKEGTTPCWPCHRMHYDWSRCHQHKATGAALCQANIGPDEVVAAAIEALTPKEFPTHGDDLPEPHRDQGGDGIDQDLGELGLDRAGRAGGGSGGHDLPGAPALEHDLDGAGHGDAGGDGDRRAGAVPPVGVAGDDGADPGQDGAEGALRDRGAQVLLRDDGGDRDLGPVLLRRKRNKGRVSRRK